MKTCQLHQHANFKAVLTAGVSLALNLSLSIKKVVSLFLFMP